MKLGSVLRTTTFFSYREAGASILRLLYCTSPIIFSVYYSNPDGMCACVDVHAFAFWLAFV